jgi:hypothetical protein
MKVTNVPSATGNIETVADMNLPILKKGTDPAEFNELFEQARKASDLLKALSHEVRLLILCLSVGRARSRFPNWKKS